MYEAIVVGLGFAGSYLSKILEKESQKILFLERRNFIGLEKCTGLISWRFKKILKLVSEDIVQNTVKYAKFYSPSGIEFEIKSKRKVYVVDRKKLEIELADNSSEKRLGESFEALKVKKEFAVVKTNKNLYKAKLVIGCDGVLSKVRNYVTSYKGHRLIGIQTIAKGNFEEEKVELWFGKEISPDFFGWVVPVSNKLAKVGLATSKNPKEFFYRFTKLRLGKIEKPRFGGLIGIGLIDKSVNSRIMLVGDSAFQVKPFSGGGVIYSSIASEIAKNTILKALEKNKFDRNFLEENYEKIWREKIENGIKKGLLLRKILYSFGERWIDFLFLNVKTYGKNFVEKLDMDLI